MRWDCKWRLKVRMFSHSRMSAGREFQVDAAATKKRDGTVWCVCISVCVVLQREMQKN